MNIRITAVPTICADIYEGQKRVYPGGAALLFAVHASEFTGIDAALIGAVGSDDNGRRIMDSISYRHIDLDCLRLEKKKPTAVTSYSKVPGSEGRFVCSSSDRGIFDGFKLKKQDKDLLLISDGVFTEYTAPCFEELLEQKRAIGFKLAVSFASAAELQAAGDILDDVDIALTSCEEEELAGLRELSEAHGCLVSAILPGFESVVFEHGRETRAEAVPSDEYVDDRGCTESYQSAFVCSYLKDHSIPKAMEIAAELAAVTFEHFGGY